MAATKLGIYNLALTYCGERHIASLTEDREPRRLLDNVWDLGGVDSCLSMGQWNFATRTVRLDFDTDVAPDFGYQWAFQKPTDWVATSAFCSDEYFTTPITRYEDEGGYWYCDLDIVYVRYVSNDATYGGDLSLWTEAFTEYVAAHFAARIIFKLTQDEAKRKELRELEKELRKIAKNRNAQGGPQRFPAPGNFVTSRQGVSSRERGNRGQLIG